jgi:hypothetical protein
MALNVDGRPLACKASRGADFGIDLRNHDPRRT